ncbi:dinucleotide-utilizing enzyme possibly involved in molybdopterin or thiamin biosynthesis [Rivularia sp. PCC 7116]|uniref:E2/E1-associated domain-containing protein n=1 Tax=Rivularia sp. PCC 7116 TaxID=373994 RepID=UPI00029EF59B|nr:E2/E1-associated domain-containing protein [Rivularia sp. PCC 7116]AFY57392.1 dinucleotide-utilizing enzyme possibly involved in molybdopterin or thiamin biosynthesis [Rivularia sp. PCC 7116]
MDIWFFSDMQRLSREREAIQNLQENGSWLGGINWRIEKQLCLDTVISVDGNEYPVKLVYPDFFPFVPPTVYPSNANEHWSSHQYYDGALCLEWGPDTWHHDVTGAQVLESAHKLLQIENPLGIEHQLAPSRHYLSAGQILRYEYGRFLVTERLVNYLSDLPGDTKGSFEFTLQWQSKSVIALIQKIRTIGTAIWEDNSLPEGLRGSEAEQTLASGVFYKTQLDYETIEAIANLEELEQLLNEVGYLDGDWEDILDESIFGVLLQDDTDCLHFFLTSNFNNENRLSSLLPVHSRKCLVNPRIPANLHKLPQRTVGIVGLGSVGSKIASSLARTGISSFFLVDEDILLPENICRNVLDWRNVGEHKVDAVAEILSCINSNIKVDVSRINLTGQEANVSLDTVLKKLSKCDLLIDATANHQVFNLLAGIAKNYTKPLVWMEVFAGGIGGMIARSCPQKDPEPQLMRKGYYHYLASIDTQYNDFDMDNYTLENQDGEVIAATDAQVSIIASYATHFATDILQERESSNFPYSMYLIGLAQSWIFKAPFHTIPIATDYLYQQQTTASASSETVTDNLTFLKEILEKKE